MTHEIATLRGRYPVKRAVVNESTAASNEIVAAVSGKSIVVVGVTILVAASVVLTWQTAAVALSGAMTVATGMTDQNVYTGLFETVPGRL